MTDPSRELIDEFIVALEHDLKRADALLGEYPGLLSARLIGETVLHYVTIENFPRAVEFLLARGADVNALSDSGDTPLVAAARLGREVVGEVLLRNGANPNATSPIWDNVLHAAVQSGSYPLVDLLLKAGADPNYRTDPGETVFDAAEIAWDYREEILEVLAKHGVVRPEEDDVEES